VLALSSRAEYISFISCDDLDSIELSKNELLKELASLLFEGF